MWTWSVVAGREVNIVPWMGLTWGLAWWKERTDSYSRAGDMLLAHTLDQLFLLLVAQDGLQEIWVSLSYRWNKRHVRMWRGTHNHRVKNGISVIAGQVGDLPAQQTMRALLGCVRAWPPKGDRHWPRWQTRGLPAEQHPPFPPPLSFYLYPGGK